MCISVQKRINRSPYRNPSVNVRRPYVIEYTAATLLAWHHMQLDNRVGASRKLKALKRWDVVQILCRVQGNKQEQLFGTKDLQ